MHGANPYCARATGGLALDQRPERTRLVAELGERAPGGLLSFAGDTEGVARGTERLLLNAPDVSLDHLDLLLLILLGATPTAATLPAPSTGRTVRVRRVLSPLVRLR